MARIRTIKPEFFQSRSLARVPRDARMTFAGLWCHADDAGRGVADPRVVKGAVWPLDDDIDHHAVNGHLEALEATGHLTLYEVDGDRYYAIVNWEKHQAASYRRGEPKHPEPPDPACTIPHDPSRVNMQSEPIGVGEASEPDEIPPDDACTILHDDACKKVLEGKGREVEGKGGDAHASAAPTPARRPNATPSLTLIESPTDLARSVHAIIRQELPDQTITEKDAPAARAADRWMRALTTAGDPQAAMAQAEAVVRWALHDDWWGRQAVTVAVFADQWPKITADYRAAQRKAAPVVSAKQAQNLEAVQRIAQKLRLEDDRKELSA